MAYTNSPLVEYTRISPNTYGPRTHAIDRISIHVFVGQVSLITGVNTFSSPGYKWSCNYVMAKDGRSGLVLPESHASICTSNKGNDERAITIETASDAFAPYKITDAAAAGLINLCVDICKRNGKNKIIWIPDKAKAEAYKLKPNEMLFSVHRWYAKKSCCGDYIFDRLGAVAEKCNKILAASTPAPKPVTPKPTPVVVPSGDVYDWKNCTYNGIRLNLVYNAKFYYEHHADLKAVVDKLYKTDEQKAKALFEHFCKNGINEGRQAIATFNPVVYRKNSPDLNGFYGDKWGKYYSHYIFCGHNESRKAY